MGRFLETAKSIIRTMLEQTMGSRTWNACLPANTAPLRSSAAELEATSPSSINWLETRQPNGMAPRLAVSGTRDTLLELRAGQSGSGRIAPACNVAQSFLVSIGLMAGSKNTAQKLARPLTIAHVKKLLETADVWCLTVDDGSWWALENGAVTHNSHYADAFRTLAMAYREVQAEQPKPVDSALTIGPNPVMVGGVKFNLPTYDQLAKLAEDEPRVRERI